MASILKVDELQYSDGTPFQLGSNPPTIQTFTASGTWTKPAGCKAVKVTVQGGGGGAGGVTFSSATTRTLAAASGGYGELFLDVTSISSVSVSVGAAGVGGANGSTNGTAGGTSSFGTHITATGGAGTEAATDVNKSGNAYYPTGGTCTGGFLNIAGAGTLQTNGNLYIGANSKLGVGGFYVYDASGGNGTGYGSGGAAAIPVVAGTYAGGSGASGIVIVEEFY